MRLRTLAAATALMLTLATPGQSVAPPVPAGPTILAVLQRDSGGSFDQYPYDHDILINLLQFAGMAGPVEGPAPSVTLLAPNDSAFISLAMQLGYTGISEEGTYDYLVDLFGVSTAVASNSPLESILMYHMVPGTRTSVDILFSWSPLPTLAGPTIRPYFSILRDNDPHLADPMLLYPLYRRASNGNIHNITGVLLPFEAPVRRD